MTSGDDNPYLLFRASPGWASLDKEEEQARALFAAMGDNIRKYVGAAREAISSEESMIFAPRCRPGLLGPEARSRTEEEGHPPEIAA